MNRPFHLAAIIALAAAPSVLSAQTPDSASTKTRRQARSCLSQLSLLRGTLSDSLAQLPASVRDDSIAVRSRAEAARCLVTVKVDAINTDDIDALALLQAEAGHQADAVATILRFAASGNPVTVRGRSTALLIQPLMRDARLANGQRDQPSIDRAQLLLRTIDGLGDGALPFRVFARDLMARGYLALGDRDMVVKLMDDALALIPRMTTPQRNLSVGSTASLAQSAMQAYLTGPDKNPDEAFAAVARVTSMFANEPRVLAYFTEDSDRRRLIGKPASALHVAQWINMPNGPSTYSFATGKPTILEFTAHWCGPCRASYKPMLDLSKKYAQQGLQVVFATRFYGYFGADTNLTTADEYARTKKYFTEEHGLPFPVAIAPNTKPTAAQTSAADSASMQKAPARTDFKAYYVSTIPQFVLIDANGIVRDIWIGWGDMTGERIERALQQTIASTTVKQAKTTAHTSGR